MTSGDHTYFFYSNQEQQAKLANLKYVLQETTDAGNDLLEQTPGDQNANTEIPEQVTQVNELYAEVNDLVDGALTNEKDNLAKYGEFETLFDSFADKIGSLEQRLESAKPLSTKLPELKAEQEELMVSQTVCLVNIVMIRGWDNHYGLDYNVIPCENNAFVLASLAQFNIRTNEAIVPTVLLTKDGITKRRTFNIILFFR